MLDVEFIKLKINQKGISIRQFCNDINISNAGFHRILQTGNCHIDTIEKIAAKLNVPVGSLFTDNDNSDKFKIAKENQVSINELRILEELVESKDQIIALLREKIKRLNELQGNQD